MDIDFKIKDFITNILTMINRLVILEQCSRIYTNFVFEYEYIPFTIILKVWHLSLFLPEPFEF